MKHFHWILEDAEHQKMFSNAIYRLMTLIWIYLFASTFFKFQLVDQLLYKYISDILLLDILISRFGWFALVIRCFEFLIEF